MTLENIHLFLQAWTLQTLSLFSSFLPYNTALTWPLLFLISPTSRGQSTILFLTGTLKSHFQLQPFPQAQTYFYHNSFKTSISDPSLSPIRSHISKCLLVILTKMSFWHFKFINKPINLPLQITFYNYLY